MRPHTVRIPQEIESAAAPRADNGDGAAHTSNYTERTTTVRFVLPPSNRAMCTKLNRVISTAAEVYNGAFLCKDFLEGRCRHGANCKYIHVPHRYLWKYLVPVENNGAYEEGFNVNCFRFDMTALYELPSQFIYPTAGSRQYIRLYNDNGDNFKEKFKLCAELQQSGTCNKGEQCEDIHCWNPDLTSFKCINTHLATPAALNLYPRMPSDLPFEVYVPHTGKKEKAQFYGNDILRTSGAMKYEKEYRKVHRVPDVKMEHCVHFTQKQMCRLGEGCGYIHVVPVALSYSADDSSQTTRTSVTPSTTVVSGRSSAPLGQMYPVKPIRSSPHSGLNSPYNPTQVVSASRISPVGISRLSPNRVSPVYTNNPYAVSPVPRGS